jgi:hypothetical protein
MVLSSALLLSLLLFALSQFFQVRGVIHVGASRIFLLLATICGMGLTFLLTRSISKRRNLIFIGGAIVTIAAALALDVWAPKPKEVVVVNPPHDTSPVAYITAGTDLAVITDMYKIGGNFAVRAHCKNTSSVATGEGGACVIGVLFVETVFNSVRQPIVPKATEEREYEKFERLLPSMEIHRTDYGPSVIYIKDILSDKIDAGLDSDFQKQVKTVLVVAQYQWTDVNGEHTNESCSWLENDPGLFMGGKITAKPQILWHNCENHNALKK